MSLFELEGTWDEIKAQLPEFKTQRLHVIIRPADEAAAPLDAALEEIWASVPEESWAQFPPDFAENMDGYLYGVPKPCPPFLPTRCTGMGWLTAAINGMDGLAGKAGLVILISAAKTAFYAEAFCSQTSVGAERTD